MPTFANPLLLFLLLLVPLILWWWTGRSRGGLRYSATRILAGLPEGRSRRARAWGLGLRGAGLVFLILALAGPLWPDPGSRVPTEGISIAMVVDVSASMNERDFVWDGSALSRLEGVKKVFRLFVDGGTGPDGVSLEPRQNDLISLVTFATYPDTACPLTLDHAALLSILEAEQPRTVAGEATTNPGDAIAWAIASLQKAPTRRKVVIFLTDGESNVPAPALTPRQAAQLAGNLGIPIYAIDAGAEDPDVQDKSDQEKTANSLQDIARLSAGKHFLARDGKALVDAVADIDKIERDRIESYQYHRYHEAFAWPALLALASLAAVLTLEATVWRRLPL